MGTTNSHNGNDSAKDQYGRPMWVPLWPFFMRIIIFLSVDHIIFPTHYFLTIHSLQFWFAIPKIHPLYNFCCSWEMCDMLPIIKRERICRLLKWGQIHVKMFFHIQHPLCMERFSFRCVSQTWKRIYISYSYRFFSFSDLV